MGISPSGASGAPTAPARGLASPLSSVQPVSQQSASVVPFGLAAVAPFLALVGKAIKNKAEDR